MQDQLQLRKEDRWKISILRIEQFFQNNKQPFLSIV